VYVVIEHVCEVILDYFVVLAQKLSRICMLDDIEMQIRKTNHEKGY